jgi:MFS family permease
MAASPATSTPPDVPTTSAELASIQRRTTWLLFASQIFGSGATAASLAVATILAASILESSTWAGLPNSVRTLGAALFSVPLSAFMAQYGRRNGLSLGYAIGVVGAALSVLSAVVMSYPLLLIGSAVFGGGFAANMLTRYAAADVSSASERGKAISTVVWGATVGAVVGPSLIGPSGEWASALGMPPIAGAFLIGVATFGLACILIFGLLRPDPLAVARRLALWDDDLRDAAPARPLRALFGISGVQVAFVTLMCSNMVMIGIMSMTPVYMHDHGHSLQIVGLVVSAHVVGMYIFSPATGWLSDRFGRYPVIVLSALVFVAAAALAVVTPPSSGPLVALGMFLIGLGWNLGFVAGSALLTDSVELLERPRMQGLADTCMGVAAALGSLASGPIMAGYGFPALNAVVALTVVFPLVAMQLTRTRSLALPNG